jgi:hypothetical protein
LEETKQEPDRASAKHEEKHRESHMFRKRREFLAGLIGAGAPLAVFARQLAAQGRPPGQSPPPAQPSPQAPPPEGNPPDPLSSKTATKAILEANDKDIKKNVEKLYNLVSELKAEVDKTDSAQVLSLGLVKKAEEIEKLAREIKTRAKG